MAVSGTRAASEGPFQHRLGTVDVDSVKFCHCEHRLKTDYDKLQKDVDDVKSRLGVRDSDEDSDEGDTE